MARRSGFASGWGNALRHLHQRGQQLRDRWVFSPRITQVALLSVLTTSTLITTILAWIQPQGVLEPLELAALDRWVQGQPDAAPDPRLLIVTITEDDLHRYQLPLSDRILADTLRRLQQFRPQVIGLDLYRDIAHPPGSADFAAQLQAPNLIVITDNGAGIAAPAGVPSDRVGFNDLTLDPDGVLRRNLLFVASPSQDYYSFALRLSLAYLAPQGIRFRATPAALWLGDAAIPRLEPTSGGYQTADTRGYQTLLHYRTRGAVAHTVTLSEVLNGHLDPTWVRDKVVLIGSIAPSLKDHVYTPYSSRQLEYVHMSGVMIHAQMTSQLLDIATGRQSPIQFFHRWTELLWIWVWAVIGGGVVWGLRHPLSFVAAGTGSLVFIGGSSWGLFLNLLWLPVVEPIAGLVAGVGVAMAHRLWYTAQRDPLTGTLTRSALVGRVGRSLTRLSQLPSTPLLLGVLVLDLDHLHLIQKQMGEHMGDRLLLHVMHRWRNTLPRTAHIARISPDQFAIALAAIDKATFSHLAERLQQSLADPVRLPPHTIPLTTSIGIATTQPDHTHTPENLLRDAHTAMYRAKALGMARQEVFATGMATEEINRFTLENDLRQGILAQEFMLYYQPIVTLQTGRIIGFEALVRWQRPGHGFISPLQFIPLAEATGLIVPLGAWILQTAAEQARQWQMECPQCPVTLSVNLSSRQLEQPNLIAQLAHVLESTAIAASALKLEVTESMVMADIETAIDRLLQLKALGLRLSMDDFGTGYSSLSQIRRLPIDTLKVDKSFVQKMGESAADAEITRMIIDLAHVLGMDVVAEGVETQADADRLRSLGCEYGQGYFWAKPLPAHEATALLQQQAPPSTTIPEGDRAPTHPVPNPPNSLSAPGSAA